MSRFQLEQELQSALRLDTSLSIGPHNNHNSTSKRQRENANTPRRRAQSAGRQPPGISLNNSNRLPVVQKRSQSSSRLSPSRLLVSGGTSPPNGSRAPRARTPNGGCGGDRFIPNRSTTDMELAHHSLASAAAAAAAAQNGSNDSMVMMGSQESSNSTSDLSMTEQQRRRQTSELLNNNGESRILSFKSKAPAPDEGHANNLKVLYSTGKPKAPAASKTRQIAGKPEKILDAPDFMDDFYLHLLDWSRNNHIAVALQSSLFVWNAADGSIAELFCKQSSGEDEHPSCVSWVTEGNILAVGDFNGKVELWDVTTSRIMRSMGGHGDRISTLDWHNYILASGSRTGHVFLHDVRVAQHHVATLSGHTQEVCGMAWSPLEMSRGVLATGGNDNMVLLWDHRNPSVPLHTFNAHQAAVKALAWCPWQPKTLATGGGTVDRTVRFWNTATGNCLQTVDTGSQVSSIVWSGEDYKELVTGHGFSHNQLTVWKYPRMEKVADLRGHTSRVLLLLKSPDGATVASAAGDETIRLWKVWPLRDKKVEGTKTKDPVSLFTTQRIR